MCFAITFACVAASSPPALRPSLSCTPQLAPCCVAQAKRLACGLLARGGELCRPPRLHGGHVTRRPDGLHGCCMLTHRPGPAILLHVAACATPPHTQTLQPLSLAIGGHMTRQPCGACCCDCRMPAHGQHTIHLHVPACTKHPHTQRLPRA